MWNEELRDISVRELFITGRISAFLAICCHKSSLHSLYDIISFYEQGKTFSDIKFIGKAADLELKRIFDRFFHKVGTTHLCDIEKMLILIYEELKKESKDYEEDLMKNDLAFAINNNLISPIALLNNLTIGQRKVIENKYTELISNYSRRTTWALQIIGFEEYVESIMYNNNELLKIRNLGRLALKEGLDFREKLIDEMTKIINLPEDVITRMCLTQEKGGWASNDFVWDYFNLHKHLPMFWIVEQVLLAKDERNFDIFINTYHVFSNIETKELKELVEKHCLSSVDYVKKLGAKSFRKLFNYNFFISDYIEYWNCYILIFKNVDSVWEEDDRIKKIIEREHCNLSALYVMKLLSSRRINEFSFFGDLEKKDNKTCWNNVFLIKKELTDIFDFEKAQIIFIELFSNNDTEYLLDATDFIADASCWKQFKVSKIAKVKSVFMDILFHEFGLSPESDGKIKMTANKRKKPADILYEILKRNGKQMHIDDIFIEFKQIYSDNRNNFAKANSLRSLLNKHEAITYRNRKSIYLLKEWGVKTGTIRNAIIEFLSKKTDPQSIDIIAKYILRHYPESNINSIRTTMQNDTMNRYSFFSDGIFGLKSKKYSAEYKEIER